LGGSSTVTTQRMTNRKKNDMLHIGVNPPKRKKRKKKWVGFGKEFRLAEKKRIGRGKGSAQKRRRPRLLKAEEGANRRGADGGRVREAATFPLVLLGGVADKSC